MQNFEVGRGRIWGAESHETYAVGLIGWNYLGFEGQTKRETCAGAPGHGERREQAGKIKERHACFASRDFRAWQWLVVAVVASR